MCHQRKRKKEIVGKGSTKSRLWRRRWFEVRGTPWYSLWHVGFYCKQWIFMARSDSAAGGISRFIKQITRWAITRIGCRSSYIQISGKKPLKRHIYPCNQYEFHVTFMLTFNSSIDECCRCRGYVPPNYGYKSG